MKLNVKKFLSVVAAAMMVGAVGTTGVCAAAPVAHHISVPAAGTGYLVSAQNTTVQNGGSFEFTVALQSGYRNTAPVVTENGQRVAALELNSVEHTYTYVIPEVYENASFTVAAVKDAAAVPALPQTRPYLEAVGFQPRYAAVANVSGTVQTARGGFTTFTVTSAASPLLNSGNSRVANVQLVSKWNAVTKTSVWKVSGVQNTRAGAAAGVYAHVHGVQTRLFIAQISK